MKRSDKMEIGISTAIFYPEILTEDAVKILSNNGFRTGEVFANSFLSFQRNTPMN